MSSAKDKMYTLQVHAHHRPVTHVKYNRDGDLLFASSKEHVVKLYRSEDAELLRYYNTPEGYVRNVCITSDSTQLICGNIDTGVTTYDVETGSLIWQIPSEDCIGTSIALCSNPLKENRLVYTYFAGSNQVVAMYDISNRADPQRIWTQTFTDDATVRKAFWGFADKTIIVSLEAHSKEKPSRTSVLDAETGNLITQLNITSYVCDIAFNEMRTLFLTASKDGAATLFDAETLEVLRVYQTDRGLNSCAISPLYHPKEGHNQRAHIIVGGGQESSQVTTTHAAEGKFETLLFNMARGELLGTIRGGFGPINSLAYHPSGNSFVTGAEEGYLRFFYLDEEYKGSKFA